MLRIAVFATITKGVFSGGRYHALMIAAMLARQGHETYFVSTNPPIFADDLAPISPDNPVRFVLTDEFDMSPAVPFDAVFIAPQMSLFPRMYRNAVRFAREAGAGLVLINYESPNWFNSFSPATRPVEKWREWMLIAKEGALVLSSAHESQKFARDYYVDLPPESTFDVWQPAINDVACLSVPPQPREKLIILFSRPSDAHKGGGDIADLIGPELSGYTIGLIIGNPKDAEAFIEDLRARGEPHGISIQPFFALSDRQKFLVLKRAAAVVFPSHFEGYGYPPIEALAADTPCVAYDLPVVRENCGDLVRYAPVGDVAELRRQLLAALEAGPVATARDPRVADLIDVDARGKALVRVIESYKDHLARLRDADVDPADLAIRITPATVVHVKRRPRVFFSLSASRPIDAVDGFGPGIAAAQIFRSGWDGSAWRHDVVLTLNDKAALAGLQKTHFTVRVGTGLVDVKLSRLTKRLLPVAKLRDDAAGLTKVFGSDDEMILAGWAYPQPAYDGLLLMDDAGRVVRVETGVKNTHYKKVFAIDPSEFCGFVSPTLRADGFDLAHVRVFLLDRGRVVAMGRLDTAAASKSRVALPVLGGEASGDPSDEPTEMPSLEPPAAPVAVGSVAAVTARQGTHAFATPFVRLPSKLSLTRDRLLGFVSKRFGRGETAPGTPVVTPMPEMKWAASECNYLEDTGELHVRGWTNRPDELRVEVWDAELNLLGVATNGESRPDVMNNLKLKGRDDLGFNFSMPFSGDLDQKIEVRLMFGTKLIAQKIFDKIKPKKSSALKVEDFDFDPQWSILWMRGTYSVADVELAELRVMRGDEQIASAALDRKFRPEGALFYRWRVEEVVAARPVAGETLTFVATSVDGVGRRIAYTVPADEAWQDTIARPDDYLAYAASGNPLGLFFQSADATPPDLRKKRRVLLVIHNLNAIERGEKREALLRLREELNARDTELILLHHSTQPSGCALPEINFFAPEPAGLVDKTGDEPAVDAETMNYARRMLYGFSYAINRRPKPWKDIEKQTDGEAAKLRLVIRMVDPALVLVWHQWNSLAVLARAVADHFHIPSAVIHEGMLPGTMTLDHLGMMAESDATGVTLAEAPDAAVHLERARAVIEEIRTRELDRKPQAGTPAASRILSARVPAGMRTVFYAGVNDWQSGNLPADHPRAAIHSPVYKDTVAGLEALLACAERQDFMVLFKPHPNLFPRPLDLHHDRLIYVREANATDCITGTDATVTLLSSLAYISLAHRKPTVLLGRNTLSGTHAAYELADHRSIGDCVAAALEARDFDTHLRHFEEHVAALLKNHLYPYGELTGFSMKSDGDTADAIVRMMDAAAFDHV